MEKVNKNLGKLQDWEIAFRKTLLLPNTGDLIASKIAE